MDEEPADDPLGDGEADILGPGAIELDTASYKGNSKLPPEVSEYYRRQATLVGIQTEHLHEQRQLVLSHMRMRRFSERFRAFTQVALSIVVTIVAVFVIVLLHDAFTSRAILVEPFDTPRLLGDDGMNGKVLAGAVLDVLTQLQVATRTSLAARTLSNTWSDDIKVDIPATGISLLDLDRLLRARFGHDLHLSGSLVRSEAGNVTLSVRGNGVLPKSFTGKANELDRIIAQAGEYIYGQSQPARYADYLDSVGRYGDELSFSKAAYFSAAPEDRPFLLLSWGNATMSSGGSQREALSLYEEALRQKPDYWGAYGDAMNARWALGDEQGAWALGEKMRAVAGGRPGRAPEFDYVNWDTLTWNLLAWRAATLADAEQHGGIGSATVTAGPVLADIDWRLHDYAMARQRLRLMPADPNDPTAAGLSDFVRGNLDFAAGDFAAAAREFEAFGRAFADPALAGNFPGYNCWIARAEEAAGHGDRADAVLNGAGRFVDCYRFRADILDRRGHWQEAQREYAAAVALAPDLPAAYYSWGLALARHQDLAGALEKFAAATVRGPHWADPLKAWGDVLTRQGKPDEAARQYAAAQRYAPDWLELQNAGKAAGAASGAGAP